MTKRRTFSDQFKAAVAHEALRGDKTVQETSVWLLSRAARCVSSDEPHGIAGHKRGGSGDPQGGANPQQIPVAELYTALETGVVDAQNHPTGVPLSFKFYEVQKYPSMTQHACSPLALAMNNETFETLSADEQGIILDVVAQAVAM
mgnify:CR=1 FL=1